MKTYNPAIRLLSTHPGETLPFVYQKNEQGSIVCYRRKLEKTLNVLSKGRKYIVV